jgi:hypothetical protein
MIKRVGGKEEQQEDKRDDNTRKENPVVRMCAQLSVQ